MRSRKRPPSRASSKRRIDSNHKNRRLKFLLLNQAFYPDVASTGQHLADLARGLVVRGHEVTVVTSRRAYDDVRTAFKANETWHGVKILRVQTLGLGRDTKWRRLADLLSFTVTCSAKAFVLPRHDVIIALTSPPWMPLLGLALASKWHCRLVCWVMDLNPDEAIAAGWLRPESLTARFLEWLACIGFHHADRVIALDRFMFRRLLSKGIGKAKLSILPPWSHDSKVEFDPVGRDLFRKRHGLDDQFVVMYSGNHSPCHPLDTVVEAAKRLSIRKDITFCFVGGGTRFRRIQQLMNESNGVCCTGANRSLPNVLCLPYQPLDQLSASLSAADVHLVVLGNQFVGIVHPCKIYNILRVRAPVIYIGPQPSSVSEALNQANARAICLAHEDVAGLITGIERLQERKVIEARAAALSVDDRFSKAAILPSMIAQLETVMQQPQQKQNSSRQSGGKDDIARMKSCQNR